MNSTIKSIVKNLPGIKTLVNKNQALTKQLEESRYQAVKIAREAIDLRLKLKRINGEKINVVFVCHRPAVWESLHSVYDSLKADDSFNTYIVAIPNKKELPDLGLIHEVYESEGAEEFWKSYGCINGYDYETKEWFDLKTLKPDYVFFQQPYNITRCEEYKSWNVALYAKICFVPYGIQIVGGEVFESVHPRDFMNCVSLYFATDSYNYRDLKERFFETGNYFTIIKLSGFPRFDQYIYEKNDIDTIWKYKGKEKKYRILWTPRWCTNEGASTFFEYYKKILKYARNNTDVEIVFRPHPQAFVEWNSTGEMPRKDQLLFRKECEEAGILIDESPEYVSTLKSTDCFLTDITSLMGEYLITRKPIVYCHKKDLFTELGSKIANTFYKTSSWDEIENTLSLLKSHIDPKSELREDIIENTLYLQAGDVGKNIANLIKNDSREN